MEDLKMALKYLDVEGIVRGRPDKGNDPGQGYYDCACICHGHYAPQYRSRMEILDAEIMWDVESSNHKVKHCTTYGKII
jgi:hypothetical protein